MGTIHALLGALIYLRSLTLAKSYQMRSYVKSPSYCRPTIAGLQLFSIKGTPFHTSLSHSYSYKLFGQKPSNTRNGRGKPKGYWDVKSRYILEKQNLSGLPDATKPFLILGIESSCDDTGVAVVRSDGVVLSNVVYSQYEIHQKFGGIVPSLAMEAHKINIEKAVTEAILKAGLSSVQEVDAIAVTRGPGLEICLRVGYQKAQALALEFKKPFVTVHHLEAHCVMARLAGKEVVAEVEKKATKSVRRNLISTIDCDGDARKTENEIASNESNTVETSVMTSQEETLISGDLTEIKTESEVEVEKGGFTPRVEYPFLALLASGGHTSILLCKELGGYEVLGGTLDDALGEAFDKAARLLGLTCTSSGGAAVEQAAKGGDEGSYPMTVPMRSKLNCDFSYAGLKNQFRLAVQTAREKEGLDINSSNAPANQMEETSDVVAVAFSHVVDRLKHALNYVEDNEVPITALVVVGGVAANRELRRRLLDLLESRAESADSRATDIMIIDPLEGNPLGDSTPVPTKALPLIFPPPSLCTDNGVMVAWAGVEKLKLGISDCIDGQEVIARWPLGGPIDNGEATFRKGGLR